MNALDEYDVQSAFEALDLPREANISLVDFYTIYLACNYLPARFTVSQLQSEVQAVTGARTYDGVSLKVCFKVLSQHTRGPREEELDATFRLLDNGGKGYLTPDDVRQLSQAAGVGPEISQTQAARMIAFCSCDGTRVDRQDFGRLLSPPSP